MKNIQQLLDIAKDAALQAGKAILDVYASGNFEVALKSDQSPLTLADEAAHAIIMSCLEVTGMPVLSEEGRDIPFDERKKWEWFWLVDPLDGTKEFIKRNGEFTVNIALVNKHAPIAGVIFAPWLNLLYYGSKETGVFKVEKEQRQLLPCVTKETSIDDLKQKSAITIVASKSHLNDETKLFIDQFKKNSLTSMGSSLKLMLLADGSADIYPRLAPTMEWDTAAGHAILNALNRSVYQINLQTQLVYNKENLLNPSFIAL